MKRVAREFGHGMKEGKFLEGSLLGRPKTYESRLPIREAFKNGKLVSLLRKNLSVCMQEIREHQSDDPEYPSRPFMRRLLNDVEDHLASRMDLPASRNVRIYSAVETPLDLAGVDFWVELYDEEANEVLESFKIDLKSDPSGRPGALADYLYFYDTDIEDSESKEAIYDTHDYKDLVKTTAEHLMAPLSKGVVRGTRGSISELQL